MVDLVAKEILSAIRNQPRSTAQMVAEITGFNLQYVHNTLRVLKELNLVENVARGVYIITEPGENTLSRITSQKEREN